MTKLDHFKKLEY